MVAQSAINHTVGDLHAVGLGEGPRALVTVKNPLGREMFFKKWANPGLLFVFIFVFSTCHNSNGIKRRCCGLRFEPGAAGWKAQMNPLSYGGIPQGDVF